MAWSASAIFKEWMFNPGLGALTTDTLPTGFTDLDTDVIKAALYDNDITPDKDVAVGSTGYNTGQWTASGNEVSDGTNWDAGGEPLVVTADGITTATNAVMFDAADTAQSGASCTLANVFGCLVYDDTITAGTVADQGMCYNYFGGGQSVTAGTFTIVWHANGVWRITV